MPRRIYQVHLPCWLAELSRLAGSPVALGQVPDSELDRLAELGFDLLWVMGVWETGPKARVKALERWRSGGYGEGGWTEADVVASPFAISEYRLSAAAGSPESFKAFRDRLRRKGLGLMVDFVPNHAGLDSPLLFSKPDCFVQSRGVGEGSFQIAAASGPIHIAHGKDPYFPAWEDTAQFELRHPQVWRLHRETLAQIAQMADAVRVDMAMLCLGDVFARTWASHPLPGSPPPPEDPLRMMFGPGDDLPGPRPTTVAEAYWDLEPRVLESGLDCCYFKKVYDLLIQRNYAELTQYLRANARMLPRGVVFLENHDEVRIATLLTSEEHRLAALLIHTLPGATLTHWGQLEGRRKFTPCVFTRRPEEEIQPEIASFYDALLRFVKALDAECGAARFQLPEVRTVGDVAGHPNRCHALFLWNPKFEVHGMPVWLVLIHFGLESAEVVVDLPWTLKAMGPGGIESVFSANPGSRTHLSAGPGGRIHARLGRMSGEVFRILVEAGPSKVSDVGKCLKQEAP